MLQTCGISSKVTLNMNERSSYLPNGKGGMDYYESKKLWRLLIGSNDLQKLVQLGFSPKRLIIKTMVDKIKHFALQKKKEMPVFLMV